MTVLDDLRKKDMPDDCKLCFYISTLSQSTQDEWEEAMRQSVGVVPNANVVRYLAPRGVKLTEASVRRHRKNHVPT